MVKTNFRWAASLQQNTGLEMSKRTVDRLIEELMVFRWGQVQMQLLRHTRKELLDKELQFFDVKLMNELHVRYREQARDAIRKYRGIAALAEVETDDIAGLYMKYDRLMAFDQAKDAIQLWIMARHDAMQLRREYLAACHGTAPKKEKADADRRPANSNVRLYVVDKVSG